MYVDTQPLQGYIQDRTGLYSGLLSTVCRSCNDLSLSAIIELWRDTTSSDVADIGVMGMAVRV